MSDPLPVVAASAVALEAAVHRLSTRFARPRFGTEGELAELAQAIERQAARQLGTSWYDWRVGVEQRVGRYWLTVTRNGQLVARLEWL